VATDILSSAQNKEKAIHAANMMTSQNMTILPIGAVAAPIHLTV
jgi:hypothetical protein